MTLKYFITYAMKIPIERTFTETGMIKEQIEVFPHIAGGCATWILTIKKDYKNISYPIALVSQQ